jgi:4-diphosphocytidyl-2-C-methyl-D-erythritol kinase
MYRVQAPAKINVSLRILAQEASGYHQLETVFAAVGLADDLSLEVNPSGRGIELEVSGADLGDPRRNLVYQAAEILLLRAGIDAGVRIRLEKRIPHGAGLGGGSSDAAAALRLLQAAFGEPLGGADLLEIAGGLGADVSWFLSPSPLVAAWGRGDRILPLGAPPELPVVLALPPFAVETAWAYRSLAEVRSRSRRGWLGPRIIAPPEDGWAEWLAGEGVGGNDFEELVFDAHPVLGEVRRQMEDLGAAPARLSGSGSSLFGIFATEQGAEDARRALSVLHSEIRFVTTRLLSAFPPVLAGEDAGERAGATELSDPVS